MRYPAFIYLSVGLLARLHQKVMGGFV